MTGPTASLNTLAYRRELSTVGNTSGEPPGTPCGPRRISPAALATGIAASTPSVHCSLRLLAPLWCVTSHSLYTDRCTFFGLKLHAFVPGVNPSVCLGYDHP